MWNAFVNLLAMERYEALSPTQRIAHLVFWYDTEVQNGGHHQYFVNPTGCRAEETVAALQSLGLDCQARVLRRAAARWCSKQRSVPVTAKEFSLSALEDEFKAEDDSYHRCSPSVPDALQEYLAARQAEFVDLDDAGDD